MLYIKIQIYTIGLNLRLWDETDHMQLRASFASQKTVPWREGRWPRRPWPTRSGCCSSLFSKHTFSCSTRWTGFWPPLLPLVNRKVSPIRGSPVWRAYTGSGVLFQRGQAEQEINQAQGGGSLGPGGSCWRGRDDCPQLEDSVFSGSQGTKWAFFPCEKATETTFLHMKTVCVSKYWS